MLKRFKYVWGTLNPFISLVSTTLGMLLKLMKLLNIPIDVPRVPHVSVDNRSKLKIWQTNTVPKNYLIKCYSGLTLK